MNVIFFIFWELEQTKLFIKHGGRVRTKIITGLEKPQNPNPSPSDISGCDGLGTGVM